MVKDKQIEYFDSEKTLKIQMLTFCKYSEKYPGKSTKENLEAFSNWRPASFAKIFILLQLAKTAKIVPVLLMHMYGLAFKFHETKKKQKN